LLDIDNDVRYTTVSWLVKGGKNMKRKEGPKYVVMNGSYGCLPDNTMYAETIEEALEEIRALFDNELSSDKIKSLRHNHYVDLGTEYGADYVEIALNTEVTYKDLKEDY
jgi:hypothetical protein